MCEAETQGCEYGGWMHDVIVHSGGTRWNVKSFTVMQTQVVPAHSHPSSAIDTPL